MSLERCPKCGGVGGHLFSCRKSSSDMVEDLTTRAATGSRADSPLRVPYWIEPPHLPARYSLSIKLCIASTCALLLVAFSMLSGYMDRQGDNVIILVLLSIIGTVSGALGLRRKPRPWLPMLCFAISGIFFFGLAATLLLVLLALSGGRH